MSSHWSLAVNTSQSRAEILLYQEPITYFKTTWNREKSHSEVITQEYLTLLKKASIEAHDIKKIYCVVGPGSFTGLRVGVSFCKTLAYSLNLPLVPINSLDLLALSCPFYPARRIVSLIDAQKNSVFLSIYEDAENIRENLLSNFVVPIKKLGQHIKEVSQICGSALDRYESFIEPEVKSHFIVEADWRESQLENWFLKNFFYESPCGDQGKELSWSELQPFYIKASAPEEKLKG